MLAGLIDPALSRSGIEAAALLFWPKKTAAWRVVT
jgi:hypothetical protein